jgi:tetratricopeptide (TPR) repeat protein
MSESEQTQPSNGAVSTDGTDGNFVPAWLAILVLVLLLAVMGLGGFVIRGLVSGDKRAANRADLEIEKWRKELQDNPDSLNAMVNLGYAYQQAEKYDKAINQYERVIAKDPQNTGALYNLGVVYTKLDLTDEAERTFWKVLKIAPDHALAARELGQIYADRKEYRSLLRAVRPVVKAHPEIADLQYLMGVAYENTGRVTWAKARYRLALKYAPDYSEARKALRRLGELE